MLHGLCSAITVGLWMVWLWLDWVLTDPQKVVWIFLQTQTSVLVCCDSALLSYLRKYINWFNAHGHESIFGKRIFPAFVIKSRTTEMRALMYPTRQMTMNIFRFFCSHQQTSSFSVFHLLSFFFLQCFVSWYQPLLSIPPPCWEGIVTSRWFTWYHVIDPWIWK